jgi:hypothetical protein
MVVGCARDGWIASGDLARGTVETVEMHPYKTARNSLKNTGLLKVHLNRLNRYIYLIYIEDLDRKIISTDISTVPQPPQPNAKKNLNRIG